MSLGGEKPSKSGGRVIIFAMRLLRLLPLATAILIAGCGSGGGSTGSEAEKSTGTPTQEMAPVASVPAEAGKDLAGYRVAYEAAKKKLSESPKDAKALSDYIAAGNRFATGTMTADALPPRTKYRDALRLYREVLKVDPANKEAKNNSQMIIDIYKSMNRPVPN